MDKNKVADSSTEGDSDLSEEEGESG